MQTIFDFQPQLYQCHSDETLSGTAKDEYFRLVGRVAEDGLEQILPLDTISEEQETALRELRKAGFIKTAVQYHGSDGHFYHVTLNTPKTEPMHDGGKRETFDTGAVRDTADGKPRPELISPFATEKLADWLRLGAEKYSPRNWELGIPLSRSLASAHRHLLKYQQGVEDGEDHLTAAYCNLMFMIHTTEMCKRGVLPESLMDLPKYREIPRVHFNGD